MVVLFFLGQLLLCNCVIFNFIVPQQHELQIHKTINIVRSAHYYHSL